MPISARSFSISRRKYLPGCIRGIPVPSDPETLGGKLRKRRLELGLRQSQAARQLEVSTRTLSLWECDLIYPAWELQPRLKSYLAYDPFANPLLGMKAGNETRGVAISETIGPLPFGQELRRRRIDLRLTKVQCAAIVGVCPKTLWGWENDHHTASPAIQKLTMVALSTHSTRRLKKP